MPENAFVSAPSGHGALGGAHVPLATPFKLPARWAAAILVVVTCAAYWPAMTGGFILDDDLLLQNDLVKDPHGLYRMWFTAEPIDYWPASNSTLWVEWRLWGTDPVGYHVTNLILHLATSLLIWVVLKQLKIPGAYLAALLFAVHPVHVDSGAWISQRKTLMAMVFFLLSIYWYVKAEQTAKQQARFPADEEWRVFAGPWYWLSLAAFILGMLSKGSVATLPLVLLLVAWWQRDRITWQDLARSAPFFLIAALLAYVNVRFQDHGGGPIRTVSIAQRLIGAGAVPWFYLYKAILPINLSFIYPLWDLQAANPPWWIPLAAAVLVTGLLWWQRRTWWGRPLLFAWAFTWITLVPVLGFADIAYMRWSLVADHYQYISLVAVTALVAAAWQAWRDRSDETMQFVVVGVAAAVVGLLALLTWRQSENYRDPIGLYRATIEVNPTCWQAHFNLGALLFKEGRLTEALDSYQESRRLNPDDAETYTSIGTALANLGRTDEALAYLQKAVEMEPKLARGHNNLGNVLFKVGKRQAGIEHLRKALEIWPSFDEAHINLGSALVETDRPQEAIPHLQAALYINPQSAEAHSNYGAALVNSGQPQEAIAQYEAALRLKPDFAAAHNGLANALMKTGQTPQAFDHYQQALKLDPKLPEAHGDFGMALVRTGRPQEAIGHFEETLRLKPGDARTLNDLGGALIESGRPQEAIAKLQEAVNRKPDYAEAWTNLAGANIKLQQYAQALPAAQQALALARSQGNAALVAELEELLLALQGSSAQPAANLPSPVLPPTTP
jgi:tetratricopeptide (TPR) repeat protein